MRNRLCSKHIVLLGVGHTNAHIVRMWGMHPLKDVDLTCISDNVIATYSGRLPAALAGQIPLEKMEIDLVRLCASVGARLIISPVVSLDHQQRTVVFAERPPVPFDALSIGIGSVPTTNGVELSGDSVLKIKPMQSFLQRLANSLAKRLHATGSEPFRVAIVGSGVAGIEIAFCLPQFLRTHGINNYELRIVTRSSAILPDCSHGLRRRIMRELERRSVTVDTGRTVVRVANETIELENGSHEKANLVIWTTGASPPPLLSSLGLPLTDNGFIATDSSLRSISGDPIFAVGDSGTIVSERLPKAGVFAVRQGPILWDNLRHLLSGEELKHYKPQRSFLKLLNAGDGRAFGEWHGWSFSGRWVMRLKERIDGQFVAKYQPAEMDGSSDMGVLEASDNADDLMQCCGCGSKLGATSLSSALGSTVPLADVAEIGGGLVASTDFFSSPTDDAFLSGRIAALHSASDVIVSGAKVTHAIANVVLPFGNRLSQQRILSDFLTGARREFSAVGAKIAGGHTIVGPRLEVGFTVIGTPCGDQLLRKSNLRPGDQLYITKPIGIGVLLAAHMRNRCEARHYQNLIDTMLQPQHVFAQIASDAGIDAGTDITGFGLAGHLVEMLSESKAFADIELGTIPILDGAIAAVEAGIESSLISDNLEIDSQIDALATVRKLARYRLLFDPQTCGGLLFGCSETESVRIVEATAQAGLPPPTRIGQVVERENLDDSKRVRVVHQLP